MGFMTPERQKQLETTEDARLTAEEMAQGCHFCPDWDFMVVCNGDAEAQLCLCRIRAREKA